MENYLVWIDLEMTGLEPQADRILEIATIVTDTNLNEVAQGPNLAIYQPQNILDNMNSWCVKVHNDSGLVERVKNSTISEREAELETLKFLKKWVGEKQAPMCGNTVHQDRRFMLKYMPELHDFFHYRNIDVSTIKELALRWNPTLINQLNKENPHIAQEDVRESIKELKIYRELWLK